MKVYKNGKIIEEVSEKIFTNESIVYQPTNDERLEALEMAMLELAEVFTNG